MKLNIHLYLQPNVRIQELHLHFQYIFKEWCLIMHRDKSNLSITLFKRILDIFDGVTEVSVLLGCGAASLGN